MKKKLNKKKIVTLILIILIFVLVIIFTVLYRQNKNVRLFFDEYIFHKNITENTLPKISTENAHTFVFDNLVVSLENSVLTFYNKSANKISTLDLEISNPIFKASGNFLCIAENKGSKVYLISNKNIVWQKDIEGKVNNVTINKNGYVAVSIAETTHKTICKVYDNKGTELFTKYLSESYIIDATISDNNKYLALAETNSSGIAIQSNIEIISIEKALTNSADTIQYNYTAPIDDFIINLQYHNDNLVCVYDNHIDVIKNNSVSNVTNFDNSNILFADVNNKLIQVEKRNAGLFYSEFELQIIDISTLNKKIYPLDREPKSVEVYGNIIAINFGTEILFINNSGWLINNYTSSQEILSVSLSNNLAGIIFKDKVEILSI